MRTKIKGGELGGVTNLAVLAPVKPGFVPGFETMTYVERLHRLLDALNEARQNLREATLFHPPFPDAIGRFGIIRSFRYVVIPPEKSAGAAANPGGGYRLSLNVTFDGGWEPYMRVIYRDLGPLLDTLFCHCDGYPGSRTSSFDRYCRWVRENEQSAGLLYADTTLTLGDQQYHERIERIQRETADPVEADRRIAAFAVAPLKAQVKDALAAAARDPGPAVSTSMRALKGLYRLSALFPGEEKRILLRFTREILQDFAALLDLGLKDSPRWKPIADAAKDELAWFTSKETLADDAAQEEKNLDPAGLQAGIVESDTTVTHGCLVLMQVVGEPGQAAAWLQALPVSAHGAGAAGGIRRTLAFSYPGLRALGIPAERLDALPQEFMDGMEARAGLLGDVRSNHPDYWPRPERCNEKLEVDKADRVDLNTVHVVLMLRMTDTDPAQAGPGLHPALAAEVQQLDPETCGLQVVAVQPMRSHREGQMPREHFGFLDGFSQPGIKGTPNLLPRDEIPPGDLCLGYPSSQGDGASEASENPLLFNGSFLVVRKLRQHADRLATALDRHFGQAGLAGDTAEAKKRALLARMMGRHQDGTPLASTDGGPTRNDFDYAGDGEGLQCPFHSHARRVNPRDGRPGMPRILRRGMSYGPRGTDAGSERGIVFMAYCANLAEQFEILQRWIAGGNSTGVSSSQADPFLAVPQPGEKRTFRYIDAQNRVARVDLGDAPFVTLEWGMYLFVPSLKALGMLTDFCAPVPASAIAPGAPPAPLPSEREAWRRLLEDTDRERSPARALWAHVRSQPDGRLPAPSYGVLIGRQEGVPGVAGVLDVLQNKDGLYSAQGYGLRMQKSIGHNYLGMDRDGGHAAQSPAVNAAIDAIDERQAFEATMPLVMDALRKVLPLQQRNPDGSIRVSVDLIALAERVLAGLCTKWVGLPEPDEVVRQSGGAAFMVAGGRVEGNPQTPRCPGNLLSASPYVFTPHPREQVAEAGRTQGPAALRAVQDWLRSGRPLGKLAQDIRDGLTQAKDIDPAELDDIIANSIAGVLLGFPPTVYGNFLRTMDSWVDDKTLWTCQRRLADVRVDGNDAYERARKALRGPLMETMRKRPVPEMLWRCPVVDGRVVGAEEGQPGDDQRLILGIASALTDPATPDEMMFGGSRDEKSPIKTEHACPGYGMGVGVMLGLIAGLLEAGTLRPTGSPVLLMLTPRADWLARATAPPRAGASP